MRLQRIASLEVTTTTNMNIIPLIPFQDVGERPIVINQLTLTSSDDCWVVVNGNSRVRVRAQFGLTIPDMRIRSLIVENAGVEIYLVAGI